MIKFICSFQNCSKSYISESGFKKHLRNFHKISANPTIIQSSRINPHPQQTPPIRENLGDDNGDWDKDQINLALQMSMKECYPDFIPDNTDDGKKCVICFTNNASIAFINCGHFVTCEECSEKLMKEYSYKRRCPVCRKPILKLLKVYF